MHVLVLGTGNPLLENALILAGHHVSLLMPSSGMPVAPVGGLAAIYTIGHWDDVDAIDALTLPDGIGAIATMDEQCIVTAARLRERLGLPGLTVPEALRYTDKSAMKTALAAAGLPVADHRVVRHALDVPKAAADMGGWPVIVKPRAGAATWNTFVIRGEDHLRTLLDEGRFDARVDDVTGRFSAGHALDSLHEAVDGFMVEQFLQLDAEYWCDVYTYDGQVLLTAPGRYDQPLLASVSMGECGYDTILPADHDDEVRAVVALAVKTAGVLGAQRGAVHAEVMRTTDGRLYVGEAAARLGGDSIGDLTSRMWGIDVPTVLACLAVGEVLQLPRSPQFRALTAWGISAPPGIVASVASPQALRALPGVLDVRINLAVGQPAPAAVGSVTRGGRVIFEPASVADVPDEVAVLRAALDLRVVPPDAAGPVLTACVA